MTKRGWWIAAIVLALALAGLLAWRGWILPIHVSAPEPATAADLPDTLTQVPWSVVIAPIAFDLGPAIARFETDVPRRFGSLDRRVRADSSARASFAFSASRSKFQVQVEGNEIIIETVVEYEGRGWYKPPLGPELSAGCGEGGDPKPRLRLRLISTPSFTPEWGLRTSTRAEVAPFSDEPRDQCHVTFLKIDVTGRIVDAVRSEVIRVLSKFDQHVALLDTRGHINDIWRTIERPVRLTNDIRLLIQPGTVQLASLGGGGDSLVAVLRLEARPKIVTGERPEDDTLATPLPRLGAVADTAGGTGLHAILEAVFSYEAASGVMRKPLAGKVIRMAGRRVRIERATLEGIGGGRVALGVTFSGAVQGRIFLTGTPKLDLATRQLTVPDLDYDVGTTDLLTRGLSWWQGDAVRNFLRAKAVIPDSAALGVVQRLALHAMNKELTDGVRLEVAIAGSRGLAVLAMRDHLIMRALADGQARLSVDRVLAKIKS